MARKLWATTTTSLKVVEIYINTSQKDAYGYTSASGRIIELSPEVFNHDPTFLDETLMHEFVHCVEFQFEDELRMQDPEECSRKAVVFGRELPRMLRNLKRVSSASPETKPRPAATRTRRDKKARSR